MGLVTVSPRAYSREYHRNPKRIALYGNFGAGNLGNECTLQAIIEQILYRFPDARLLCFCTNPQDVRTRHQIAALPSEAVTKTGRSASLDPQPRLLRTLRIAFQRIPLELVHWIKTLRAVWRTDMLIVAGTGIVSDHLCGPLGWPYDIFKLSVLTALCRTRLVFLSVGVGPIDHPLSRWLIRKSLALAHDRSYRDQWSRQYVETLGFDTYRDLVYPDVAFGLSPVPLLPAARAGQAPVIGLGLKDYASSQWPQPRALAAFRQYLNAMATFVAWLHEHGYRVRLLAGDVQYDTRVLRQFLDVLKTRNIATDAPMLRAEAPKSVEALQRQISETDAVISPRYHNLVMALTQNKPVVALSDHPKLDSLMSDLGLAQYLLSMDTLTPDILIDLFRQQQGDLKRLRSYVRAEVGKYRQRLDVLYGSLFAVEQPTASAALPEPAE